MFMIIMTIMIEEGYVEMANAQSGFSVLGSPSRMGK